MVYWDSVKVICLFYPKCVDFPAARGAVFLSRYFWKYRAKAPRGLRTPWNPGVFIYGGPSPLYVSVPSKTATTVIRCSILAAPLRRRGLLF